MEVLILLVLFLFFRRPRTRLFRSNRPRPQIAPRRTRPLTDSEDFGEKSWLDNEIEGRIIEGYCRVEDGDTIYIKGNSIRIFGIDAPELDRPYGQKSKWKMVEIVKGHKIKAVLTGEGSYERYVARCYLRDGRDVAAELVKAGLALDMPFYSGGEYRPFEPYGIRKKLFEKARVVGLRHPEELRTLGGVLDNDIALEGYCFTCGNSWLADLRQLEQRFGRNLKIIGQLGPCRSDDCSGRAILRTQRDGKPWPLV